MTAHCIARGPPWAITGLPASTSGVDAILPNEPLRTFVLSGNPELTKHLGLKATKKWVVMNGPIECRLVRYDVRAKNDRGKGTTG